MKNCKNIILVKIVPGFIEAAIVQTSFAKFAILENHLNWVQENNFSLFEKQRKYQEE
jgi:hypothetical protein